MKMAGITPNSRYATSGQIELDENGEPLGIFGEGMALYKIRTIVPPYNQEQIEEQLLFAMRHALANGLTSVGSRDVIESNYQSVVDAYIKLFANGSLGSRTAFMREPYHDDPSTRGFQTHSQEEMDALVRKNHENGFQVIVHAIGDAAIDEVITAFEKATGGHENNLRHGIVHCQITDLPLLQRMAHNDILTFMQPIFLTNDLYMIENRVGKELALTSYAHATMKKLGIKASYGTDSPVESMSPIECIDCAVNRYDVANGYPEEGFYPSECVDVYTAVDAYTADSAYAEFAEDRKGRIKPGFFADMTLLDRDIFSIPRKEIRTARVLWTMVGGKMAYRAG
jgi:predicted amidohydrolase YtcJ